MTAPVCPSRAPSVWAFGAVAGGEPDRLGIEGREDDAGEAARLRESGQHVFEHRDRERRPQFGRKGVAETGLGAGSFLDRNDGPDPAHLRTLSAAAMTVRASASLSARLVIKVRVKTTGMSRPREIICVFLVGDVEVEEIGVVPRHRRAVDRQAELRHHLGGRALDRLAADDRRHRNDRRAALVQGVAHPGQGEDRADADERVRRADHDQPQFPVGERGEEIGVRAGRFDAGEFDFPHHRLAAQAHEIILEIEPGSPPPCPPPLAEEGEAEPRTRVRTGSSDIGKSRVAMPRRRRKSSITAERLSPDLRRRVRSTWVARSPSPSRNHVSPPSASNAAIKVQVSPRRPQPSSGLSWPESV